MTKSEGMTKPEWTKPATAQLRGFGHSGFAFHSSFVIQRLMQIRFMVPMHAEKQMQAFMNGPLSLPSPPPKAGERVAQGREWGLRFKVLMHARSERALLDAHPFAASWRNSATAHASANEASLMAQPDST